MEDENRRTARLGYKIEAFRYSSTIDPETFAKTLKSVALAISELYAQGSTGMPFEGLYRLFPSPHILFFSSSFCLPS
jgi:hypothetical protein